MSDRYREQQEAFNAAYQLGSKTRQEYGFVWSDTPDPAFGEMFTAVSQLLPPRSRALDIGCGDGRNSFLLADNHHEVLGFDSAPAAVELAKELATLRNKSGVFFREMDAFELPESLGTFDLVIQWNFLEHIYPDQHHIFAERLSKLTKSGSLVLASELSTKDTRAPAVPHQLILEHGCIAYFFDRLEIRDLYSPWFDIAFHEEVHYPQIHDPAEVRCLHNMILKRR